jgi:hypothetical protein
MLMKGFRTFRCLSAFSLAFVLFAIGSSGAQSSGSLTSSNKNGTLVVLVTRDDVNRTPEEEAYIEAHSFNVNGVAEKSFAFVKVKAGRYEATVPPGVYDVFVSAPSSTPRCRRSLVTAGYTGYWNLMLEHDDVYLER